MLFGVLYNKFSFPGARVRAVPTFIIIRVFTGWKKTSNDRMIDVYWKRYWMQWWTMMCSCQSDNWQVTSLDLQTGKRSRRWVLWASLLGLLAMIKCSICSCQCDNWYDIHCMSSNVTIVFRWGVWNCELARKTYPCRASFSLLLRAATLSGNKFSIIESNRMTEVICDFTISRFHDCEIAVVTWRSWLIVVLDVSK